MRLTAKAAANLVALAELRWQAAAQDLAVAAASERAAAAAVRQMAEEREAARNRVDATEPVAMRAMETWQRWASMELARRAAAAAQDRDALQRQRDLAAAALSRHMAAGALRDKVLAEARHKAQGRALQALLDQQMRRGT